MNGSNEAAPAAGERARAGFEGEARGLSAGERAWFAEGAGRTIAATLWKARSSRLASSGRVSKVLAWTTGVGETGHEPAPPTLNGALKRAGRNLRFALSALSPEGRAAATLDLRPSDVFDVVSEAERAIGTALEIAEIERDGAVLAIHAAALGALPDAMRSPSAAAAAPSPFEALGEELGLDAAIVSRAIRVAHAIDAADASHLSRAELVAIVAFVRDREAALIGRPKTLPPPALEPADHVERSARFPSLLAVLEAHPGRWEPEAVNAAESFAARLENDRPAAWWVTQLDRFDEAAKSARAAAPVAGGSPRGSDDDEGGGPSTPPSSASPAAPPAAPQGSATMPPPTLGSPPWRGSPPAPRPRRAAPHLRLVSRRPEPEELVRVAVGGGR